MTLEVADRFQNSYQRRLYRIPPADLYAVLEKVTSYLTEQLARFLPERSAQIFVGMETCFHLRHQLAVPEIELVIGHLKMAEFTELLQRLGSLQVRTHWPTPTYSLKLRENLGIPNLLISVRRPLTYLKKAGLHGTLTTGNDFVAEEDLWFYPHLIRLGAAELEYRNAQKLERPIVPAVAGMAIIVDLNSPAAVLESVALTHHTGGLSKRSLVIDQQLAQKNINTLGLLKREEETARSESERARVREFFWRILSLGRPSEILQDLQRLDLLSAVMPEIHNCVGCRQNPKHHSHPVFEHLIYSLDAACQLTDRMDVRFAALCHDLGKPETKALRPGAETADDWTFNRHQLVSATKTFDFSKRWKFPIPFAQQVIHLVRHHQYNYTSDWTDNAVRSFIRTIGITPRFADNLSQHPIFLLRQADRGGNDFKKHMLITDKQRSFQERIQRELKTGGKNE